MLRAHVQITIQRKAGRQCTVKSRCPQSGAREACRDCKTAQGWVETYRIEQMSSVRGSGSMSRLQNSTRLGGNAPYRADVLSQELGKHVETTKQHKAGRQRTVKSRCPQSGAWEACRCGAAPARCPIITALNAHHGLAAISCLCVYVFVFRSIVNVDAAMHLQGVLRNELIYIPCVFMPEYASSVSQLLSFIVPLVVIMAPSLIAM